MRRILAGATGLIGRRLVEHWLKQQHTIVVIGRSRKKITKIFGDRVQALTWEELQAKDFVDAEVVVNLTGANIAKGNWTQERKKNLVNSRVGSTKKIATLLAELKDKAPLLLNASAIGIYGIQEPAQTLLPPPLDEDAPLETKPNCFISFITNRWEKAAEIAITNKVRVIFLRFGVVLAKEGGALPRMMWPFKMYIGGTVGSGRQPFSWVAMDDVLRAIDFLLAHKGVSGAVNIVSPNCIEEKVFAKTLANVLDKPCWLNFPAPLVKLIFGEMGEELLLSGQHVYPERLTNAGFKFLYGDIESALNREIVTLIEFLRKNCGFPLQREAAEFRVLRQQE